jgi:hypothetical protein
VQLGGRILLPLPFLGRPWNWGALAVRLVAPTLRTARRLLAELSDRTPVGRS